MHHRVHFLVADQNQPHDAAFTAEALLQCVERVKERSRLENKALPKTCVIVADNTVRENKNNTMLTLLSFIVMKAMFEMFVFFPHRKGHTHNRLDQLYGVIPRLFQNTDILQDLDAVISEIEQILKRPSLVIP